MSWRTSAARVIVKCIEENPQADEKELRKIISAAYPFGPREMHPYKIWLSEVKYQLRHHAMSKSQTMTFPAPDHEADAEPRPATAEDWERWANEER